MPPKLIMTSHCALPAEIRLKIYEMRLAEYFNAPGVCVFPTRYFDGRFCKLTWAEVQGAMIKTPVPATLQIDSGEMRSHLLQWLAREKDISPMENAPVLSFPDRPYCPERDIIYLDNRIQIHLFCKLLEVEDLVEPGNEILEFAIRVRRVAIAASVRHTDNLPRFLGDLDELPGLEELLVVFLILEHGKLEYITSVPKENHSAYSLEPLCQSDLGSHQKQLKEAITRLDELLRPMLWTHAKGLKITACKMIPRP
ncbi:hypothetical protein J7T55_005492 [Diaporthe amygdali]|uniref:uncharacterized protein n=1 Tax=Phomopsis amygdali TaxID=1214568 RepID=UPI0022FDDD9F|nr:uncharacterized protein J7T55_005492 [Diaporthe amygdali]KAJ0108945.1 hypothetical protein J7T55_005492 [Diaporthe amygdali]